METWGYLIRYDELTLKGKNRPQFEKQLLRNIENRLSFLSSKVQRRWGRLFIQSKKDPNIEEGLALTFGLASFSPVVKSQSTLEEIQKTAHLLFMDFLEKKTEKNIRFRITTRRVDKQFLPISIEVNKSVADHLLSLNSSLSVDLKNPELDLGIEIREEGAFLYGEKMEGLRGLPVGTGEKVLTLISGGIDSPVASWMMMKRGCPVDFVHFFSYPYTGHQSREKVIDLVKRVGTFQNHTTLYVVSFTQCQEIIREKCRERYRTILYRRMMNRIATQLAVSRGAKALVTGESLGQVASQTLENISVVGEASNILILRPLIGFNKQQTIEMAKKIGTYEISIQPFDDCCTIFQSKNPSTKSKLAELEREEERLPISEMVEKAFSTVEEVKV